MAINLYSKDSVDTLLAAKLSDAPSDGSTYGRKDGAWEVVGGGGGGATWGSITGTLGDQTDLDTALNAKAPLDSPSFTSGITADGGVTVPGPSGNSTLTYSGLDLGPSSGGITFADSTVQTTAAPSADVLTANAIGANIAGISGSTGTWVGNSLPAVAGLVTWGIYNVSDGLLSYSYSSGSSFYLSGSVTTSGNTVQISGSNSSFYIL
jgi:hypothetical protein